MLEVTPITPSEIGALDLVPQAIIARPPAFFERERGLRFEEGLDDLDRYWMATLVLHGEAGPPGPRGAPATPFVHSAASDTAASHVSSSLMTGGSVGTRGTNLPFALMQYSGAPKGTTTLLLPSDIDEIPRIGRAIALIPEALRLPPSAVSWQRSDGPAL